MPLNLCSTIAAYNSTTHRMRNGYLYESLDGIMISVLREVSTFKEENRLTYKLTILESERNGN